LNPSRTERSFFAAGLGCFCIAEPQKITGSLLEKAGSSEGDQGRAWTAQIDILRQALAPFQHVEGASKVYFEWSVPRVGKRIDVVLVIRNVVFVVEFKVGAREFLAGDRDQVWDYALDLKNFHKTSHDKLVCPVLVATEAEAKEAAPELFVALDRLYCPVEAGAGGLGATIARVLDHAATQDAPPIDADEWDQGPYSPTPTIVEAALALYRGHKVEDIANCSAEKANLGVTAGVVHELIEVAQREGRKSICFVTGVPGAGKTLVGLTVATEHSKPEDKLHTVYLSGNGPLVSILREALARDQVAQGKVTGKLVAKGEALRASKAFIQPIYEFLKDCTKDPGPPAEHVTIFDEAQRAWDLRQMTDFMKRKMGVADFEPQSEAAYLISCIDRHREATGNWGVIVCLVGGGQEINRGEAGIGAWVDAVIEKFPHWHVHLSSNLMDSEYGAGAVLEKVAEPGKVAGVHLHKDLHLSVSMRSFRAEKVSAFVKAVLDHEEQQARDLHSEITANYPIVLTRDLTRAKAWLKEQARGTERYGLVVSSNAQRLKPHAIDVRSPMNPVHWFLSPKADVRSSYYLEDVATEFHVQGLELDWAGVVWDGDFRRKGGKDWGHYCFRGQKWQRVKNEANQSYLKNAYRVLLTRARQGMVIVVPEGDPEDPTRDARFYDPTFEYLAGVGLKLI
jgi:DUF2075 family protein